MVDFRQGLALIAPDLMDVLLPFALIFTIIYAVSGQVKLLKDNQKFQLILSLVIALLVVIPHVTQNYFYGQIDVVNVINRSIPQVAMIIVAMVLVLMLIGATGKGQHLWTGWIRWVALALVVLIFIDNIKIEGGYGLISQFAFLGWFASPDIQAILLIGLIFGLIIWFVTGDSSSENKRRYHKELKAWEREQEKSGGYTSDEWTQKQQELHEKYKI